MVRPRENGRPRPSIAHSTEQSRPRGRPRTVGNKLCARCQQMVAKIRVRWPDGAICGVCFTEAMRTHGRCAECGDERLLPGRRQDGKPICRDCAGITKPLMTCANCGTEAERFRGGACIRCVLTDDLAAVLRPSEPPDLRLHRLIEILVVSPRPESIYTWLRGQKAQDLLTRIGTRELQLTPQAFDSLPRSPAVDHLREILIHHRLMVAPADPHLAIFERWLKARLRELAPRPAVANAIANYATWRHLRRLRELVGTDKSMDIACRNARQAITEAGKFLLWLEDEQGTSLTGLSQLHIDLYLEDGVTTRSHIKNFISWYAQGRGGKRRYYVPPRYAKTVPALSQRDRLRVIRNVIEFGDTETSTRVAALIHLLWATPLTRIARMTTHEVDARPDGIYLALGPTPVLVPEFLTPLFWSLISDRANQQTTNRGTDWLFPGYRAGRPISVPTLQQRLTAFGLQPQRARNSTLRHLVAQIDPHSLADTLGYSLQTMSRHGEQSGSHFGSYAGSMTPGGSPVSFHT